MDKEAEHILKGGKQIMVELKRVGDDKYRLVTDTCPQGREVTLDEAMSYVATKEGVPVKENCFAKHSETIKPVAIVATLVVVFLANNEIVSLAAMCAWLIPLMLRIVKQAVELDGGGK